MSLLPNENFGLSLVTVETAELTRQARAWMNACLRNAGPERLLVLCGNNGAGKTTVLRGLQRFLDAARIDAWDKGYWVDGPPSVKFADWHLWANLDPARAEEERLALEDLCEVDVLLLDDVGAEVDRYKSGLPLANLSELFNRRAQKWTALTTNYLPEQWIGSETVMGRFGKRVGDRLFRHSIIVPLRHTPSYALTNRKET